MPDDLIEEKKPERVIKKQPAWKVVGREIFELARIMLFAVVIVIPIRYFVFQTFTVSGMSMYPTFHDKDYLIIDELTYHTREPQRGEVIVFRYPKQPSEFFIKRVIGLPGETIRITNGEVFVGTSVKTLKKLEESYLPPGTLTYGSETTTLDADHFFVLGDNRNASLDSRVFGQLERHFITGRTLIRGWPFDRVAYFGK